MLITNKRIAIIGGGPGGLTLARLLQLKGADVHVYERDLNKDVRIQGATLDLHFGSGLRAIEAAGLTDAFKNAYRPGAEKGRVVDEHTNILYDEHDASSIEDFSSEHFRPEIDRDALRNLLLNALEPGTVIWDSQFKNMTQTGDAWHLEFKNGTTAVADIVIGSDGANSKIRPFITPVKAFYSGAFIIQGNVPNAATAIPDMHQLLKGGKIYVHRNGKFLHISSKGDGSIDFYISFKKDENWLQENGTDLTDRKQLITWFKKELTGWDTIWLEFAEHTTLPLLLRPQYCMPLDQHWDSLPNLTMLGDAAHLMPASGEGVNLAMLDALELSDCLTSTDFETVHDAIAAYEKQMLNRAIEATQTSLETVEWMHAEDAQEKLLQLFTEH